MSSWSNSSSTASSRNIVATLRDGRQFPSDLERTIRIRKRSNNLGLTLERIDDAVNGYLIKTIPVGGALFEDGRLNIGDYLIKINHESLRRVTYAKAQTILKRAELMGTDVSMTYVSKHEAERYAENLCTKQVTDVNAVVPQNGLSPRSATEERRNGAKDESQPLLDDVESPPLVRRQENNTFVAETTVVELERERADSVERTTMDDVKEKPPDKVLSFDFHTANGEIGHDESTEEIIKPVQLVDIAVEENVQLSIETETNIPDDKSQEKPPTIPAATPQVYCTNGAITPTTSEPRRVSFGSASTVSSKGLKRTEPKYKYWGEPRMIELVREDSKCLGVGIVGGTMEVSGGSTDFSQHETSGIFIKDIAPGSIAESSGRVNVGDRIISVNGVDLMGATHESAVTLIKNASSPVQLVLQSLHSVTEGSTPSPGDPLSRVAFVHDKTDRKSLRTPTQTESEETVQLIKQPNLEMRKTASTNAIIDRLLKVDFEATSAALLPKAETDFEPEDSFGYTRTKVLEKYADIGEQVHLVELTKGEQGLGLSLAGHKDRAKFCVFIIDILQDSPAAALGNEIFIGDEIVEVNGIVLRDRSHLVASSIIKNAAGPRVKLIIYRRSNPWDEIAVPPIRKNRSKIELITEKIDEEQPTVQRSSSSSDSEQETTETKRVVEVDNNVKNEETPPPPPTTKKLKIRRGPDGFGITLTKGKTADDVKGYFVTHLSPLSPVSQEKILKIGDQVLAVNGTVLNDDTSTRIAEIIQSNEEIELVVCSHSIVPLPRVSVSKQRFNVSSANCNTTATSPSSNKVNLSTNPILPGCETLVEIDKSGRGLGLSIVGGTDTILGVIVIHEIYPDGAAAKDGRLQPWDQIVKVQGQSLKESTHENAINILRQTPSKVRLLIYRDTNLKRSMLDPNHIYHIFQVELVKKPGKGLGVSIVGRKNEPGVFVSEVVKNSVAELDGQLKRGDQILCVNGQDLTNSMHEQAAAILKTCSGKVVLKIGRWKVNGREKAVETGTKIQVEESSSQQVDKTMAKVTPCSSSVATPVDVDNKTSSFTNLFAESSSIKHTATIHTATTPGTPNDITEGQFDESTITISKMNNKPLGLGVGTRPRGVLVTSIQRDTPVFDKLKVGDKILAVNGQSISDQATAVSLMKSSGDQLVIKVSRPKTGFQNL